MKDQGLDGGKCIGVCTEGAASMVSCYSDATAKIKKVANKNLLSVHYLSVFQTFFTATHIKNPSLHCDPS